MKKQRLVLRHKKSGKIASRTDQAIKALSLEAQRLKLTKLEKSTRFVL
jgi:hypothetical protein